MTTEERLRDAAKMVRGEQRARALAHGMYLDELLEQAAEDLEFWRKAALGLPPT